MRALDGRPHSDSARIDAISLTRLYDNYNRQHFEGRLPQVTIHIAERENYSGLDAEYDQASGTIFLHLSEGTAERTLRVTLLHEMVHVAVPEDAHGARFRAELQRLAEAGDDDAEFEVWRMVGDDIWDDGWVGEESGRWERYRGETEGQNTARNRSPEGPG